MKGPRPLHRLFEAYREAPNMAEKLKELARETMEEIVKKMSAEERLRGLTAEEVVKGLPQKP
jgi:hypothetical protein